jgi:opacity protein-like surface antigen
MKHLWYLIVVLGAGSLLNLATSIQPAQAQVAYGSYVGVGPSVGLSDGAQIGGVIAFRYKLLESPISFRAQALVGNGTAVVPTVSYDVPLNWQTDAYLGAGLTLASGEDSSPVGNKISFALQPGIDYVVPNSNTVIFGNAIIAFDAYRDGSGTAFSLQGGVGLRF